MHARPRRTDRRTNI